jgi:hypothetical protein
MGRLLGLLRAGYKAVVRYYARIPDFIFGTLADTITYLRTFDRIRPIIDWLHRIIYRFLLIISPVGAGGKEEGEIPGGRIFLIGLSFGFLISLVANGLFSYFSGTLYGTDSRIFYFKDDVFNLIIYAFIAPLYIGFCFCIIAKAYFGWGRLRRISDQISGPIDAATDRARNPTFMLVAAILPNVVVFRYIAGISEKAYFNGKLYWFLSSDSSNMIHFNTTGYVYVFAILIKMVVIVVAVLAFTSVVIEVVRTSYFLAGQSKIKRSQVIGVVWLIRFYEQLVVYIKYLFAVVIVHGVIWALSPLGQQGKNIWLSVICASFIFLFVVESPKLYFDHTLRNNKELEKVFQKMKKEEGFAELTFREKAADWLAASTFPVMVWFAFGVKFEPLKMQIIEFLEKSFRP